MSPVIAQIRTHAHDYAPTLSFLHGLEVVTQHLEVRRVTR